MAWMTIESAPKDGSDILACNAAGEVRICRWDNVSMNSLGWQVACFPANDWNWYDELRDATHWMPVPTAPSRSEDTTRRRPA